MMNKTTDNNKTMLKEIAASLMQAKRVLIVGHANPDGDSLGSQLGLAEALGENNIACEIVNEGIIPNRYKFLPGIASVKDIDTYSGNGHSFDVAVFMECSSRERIGRVDQLISEGCRIINIDHHHDNNSFGDINYLDFTAAAAGEMVFEILRNGSFTINKRIATNLYTAILTDTGRFHFSSTTPKCLRTAAELVEYGADVSQITDQVYFNQSSDSLLLTGRVLQELEYFLDNRVCFMTITQADLKATRTSKADTEGLVNYTLRADGVQVGAQFSENGSYGTTKVSLRSRRDISIVEVALKHGGGGHKNACGCTLEYSIEEAKRIILKDIEEHLHGQA